MEAAEETLKEFIDYDSKVKLAADNLFKAHKQAIGASWPILHCARMIADEPEDGLMDFSEASFLRSQGLGWNETSATAGGGTLWDDIYDGVYFSATQWKTIDKGLNRLAEAFHPIVDNRLSYGRRIERLTYDEDTGKTGFSWTGERGAKESREYDKTLVAVPFSVAKLWRMPAFDPVMREAISGLTYSSACKVSVRLVQSWPL